MKPRTNFPPIPDGADSTPCEPSETLRDMRARKLRQLVEKGKVESSATEASTETKRSQKMHVKMEGTRDLSDIKTEQGQHIPLNEAQPSQKIKQSQSPLKKEPSSPVNVKHSQPSKTKDSPESKPPPRLLKKQIVSEEEWDPSKLAVGLKQLYIPSHVNVEDHHLEVIIAAGPAFCHKLEKFSCGSSDTGCGLMASKAAVFRQACPNLREVWLDSATRLTDDSLLAFLKHCPLLRTIGISGNDKATGKITGKTAFVALKVSKGLAKNLKKLELVDQYLDTKALSALTRARKGLEIVEGSSGEKWYNCGTISTWRGGKVVSSRSMGGDSDEMDFEFWF
ncbi:hypothetical protein H2200_010831 [Cladophialophora chaetospira]|uniref:Uncharacterized protein n=1 Tax=Cladophialophora chaetospira TaxID=386627 RepID=A0AA39CE02_9EURO|nr:hypothetical protein H2200_010831 [Cladophialophora chaetospira]